MGKRRSVWGLVGVLIALAVTAIMPTTALAASGSTTKPPSNVTNNSATLNGQASSSAGMYYFQYGPASDPTARRTPPVAFTGTVNVSAKLTGLMPETTYSYRLVVEPEAAPQPVYGNFVNFTTLAAPGTIATTGQATDIMPSSADLNGVANTTSPDSSWYFQWGRTTSYGHQTRTQHIGQGFTLVAARIRGLRPKTRYHFRLVVLQAGQGPAYGNDSSFKTRKPFGHARLTSRRLAVQGGLVAVPFRCTGRRRAPCKGRVSVSTRSGHHTVSCGRGRLSMTARHQKTIDLQLGPTCERLVKNAPRGQLAATLRVVFSTPQAALRARVTLLRR